MSGRRWILLGLWSALATAGCRHAPACPPAGPPAPRESLSDAARQLALPVERCRTPQGEALVLTRFAFFNPTKAEVVSLGQTVGKLLGGQFGERVVGVETVASECEAGSAFGLQIIMREDAPLERVLRTVLDAAGSQPTLRLLPVLVPAPPPPPCPEHERR